MSATCRQRWRSISYPEAPISFVQRICMHQCSRCEVRLEQVVQISIQENIDAGHRERMNGVGFYDDSPETSEAILFNGFKHASPLVVVNVVGDNRTPVNAHDR